MVLQSWFIIFSVSRFDVARWKETALLFFKRWLFRALTKNKCAVCALAFLVLMFNFSTISALCTTVSAMISLWNHPQDYSAEIQPFDLYFYFDVAQNHNEL